VAASVATAETTTSPTYTDLATTGPAVTATISATTPGSGRALVSVTSGTQATNGSTSMFMSFAVSGATTMAATDTRALVLLGNNLQQASASFVVTGLNAGSTTFTAKYKVSGSGTATFSNRSIWVIPLT
jgi:hypothetical protein